MSRVHSEGKRKRRSAARGVVAAVLAVSLSVVCIPGVLAYSDERAEDILIAPAPETPAVYEKTEVVYASLSATGEPEGAYVVNQFDVTEAGRVVDHGAYDTVINLTDTGEIAFEDGVATFSAAEGSFYYQGNMADVELPWHVAIVYELDGTRLAPEELAGRSGELVMRIVTTQNAEVDPAFFESFMTQITVTLDGDACQDIVAEGATVASAGRDRTIAFTALPGKGGDFTLSAQVVDFEMKGIQIAALPYAMVMEMPDVSEMTGGIEELSSAISQLNEGTAALADGVGQLADGASQLADGVRAFDDGLVLLNGSAGDLVAASGQINGAMQQIGSSLGELDLSMFETIGDIPADIAPCLRQIADEFDELHALVSVLPDAYENAYVNLDAALAALPETLLTEEELAAVQGAADVAGAEVGEDARVLIESYEHLQAVRDAYGDGAVFADANTVLQLLGGDGTLPVSFAEAADVLRTVADLLDELLADAGTDADSGLMGQMTQMVEGLQMLADSYAQFDEGLGQFAGGLDELTAGHGDLTDGLVEYADGVGALDDGASALSAGISELNGATINLPSTMKDEIEAMMDEYEFPEFDPVSFVSGENEQVIAVQFVLTTEPIEMPAPADEPDAEKEELSIIDRLLALFK